MKPCFMDPVFLLSHSSYFIGPEIWLQMNLANRCHLTQERNQYKMQQAQSMIATLNTQSTIATLNAKMHPANSFATKFLVL